MNLDWTTVDASPKFKGNMITVALATIALHSVLFLPIFLFCDHFEEKWRDISGVLFSIYEAAGNDTTFCSCKSSFS